jgi:hypothetical protein
MKEIGEKKREARSGRQGDNMRFRYLFVGWTPYQSR